MFKRMSSLAAVSVLLAAPALAAELTVTLTDVQANGAPLYVGVQTEEQFMHFHFRSAGRRVFGVCLARSQFQW